MEKNCINDGRKTSKAEKPVLRVGQILSYVMFYVSLFTLYQLFIFFSFWCCSVDYCTVNAYIWQRDEQLQLENDEKVMNKKHNINTEGTYCASTKVFK